MEKIDKAIEILQGYNNNKVIEWKEKDSSVWYKLSSSYTCDFIIDNLNHYDWRIGKEASYRPYANAEEFLKDFHKHGPYIYDKRTYTYKFVCSFDDKAITYLAYSHGKAESRVIEYEYLLGKNSSLIWPDGTPCGILEQ